MATRTINRPALDSYGNFSIIDKNSPIAASGLVDSWEIYAAKTTPVRLLIFRQTGSSYELIAESPLVTPSATGVSSFSLASPIPVQAGDLLGYYTQSTGAVPYSGGGTGGIVYSSNGAGDPVVGTQPGGRRFD